MVERPRARLSATQSLQPWRLKQRRAPGDSGLRIHVEGSNQESEFRIMRQRPREMNQMLLSSRGGRRAARSALLRESSRQVRMKSATVTSSARPAPNSRVLMRGSPAGFGLTRKTDPLNRKGSCKTDAEADAQFARFISLIFHGRRGDVAPGCT